MKSLYTKMPARKRTSNDPAINHIRRGIAKVRTALYAASSAIPGVFAGRLLSGATKKINKAIKGR